MGSMYFQGVGRSCGRVVLHASCDGLEYMAGDSDPCVKDSSLDLQVLSEKWIVFGDAPRWQLIR